MSGLLNRNKYNIKIKYIAQQKDNGNIFIRVIDEKNIRLLSEKNISEIQELNTTWRDLTYKDQSEANSYANEVISSRDGNMATIRNSEKYDFWLLSHCLLSWDLKDDNGAIIPVAENVILELPLTVSKSLIRYYKEIIFPNDEILKN